MLRAVNHRPNQYNKNYITLGINIIFELNYILRQKVLGRTNFILSFDTTRTAYKTMLPTVLRCRGKVFIELLSSNERGIYRDPQTCASNNYLFLRVFVAAGTSLPNRCLAMKGGIPFTEPLYSNDWRDTHTDTRNDG
jgi:hypothetical protein